MKRILFVGLSLLVAIGCGDSKPVSTVDNSADETSAVKPEADGEDTTEQAGDDAASGVQKSTVATVDDGTEFGESADADVEPEVQLSLEEQYKTTLNDFLVQRSKVMREYRSATTAEEQQKSGQDMATIQQEFATELRELFRGKEEHPTFIDAVPWFVMSLSDTEIDDVLNKLSEFHLDNEKWFETCIMMSMQNVSHPQFVNFIEKQATEGSGRSQVAAQYVLAEKLNPKTDEQRIVQLLTSVINYDGDLIIRGRFDLKAQADDKLFTLTKLAIGKEAPEIEGQDSDGVTFKLSDYRGKVVMLDFWGNW